MVQEQLVQLPIASGPLVAGAFFVETDAVDGDRLLLVEEEAHHVRVRRYREGDMIDVIDGEGCAYRVRIDGMTGKRVEAQIVERHLEWGESPVCLHLAAAVPKGSRFDLVIEKGTEVGVASIFPVLTERGVARPAGDSRRVDRWHRLAREAAKQCGRSRVPRLAEPMALPIVADALARQCSRLLVASAAGAMPLAEALSGENGPIGLFIGPEGGFESAEYAALEARGARAFTWGERVLRAETAAIVLSTLVLDTVARRIVRIPKEA